MLDKGFGIPADNMHWTQPDRYTDNTIYLPTYKAATTIYLR